MEKLNKVHPENKQIQESLSDQDEIPDELVSDFVIVPDRLTTMKNIRKSVM